MSEGAHVCRGLSPGPPWELPWQSPCRPHFRHHEAQPGVKPSAQQKLFQRQKPHCSPEPTGPRPFPGAHPHCKGEFQRLSPLQSPSLPSLEVTVPGVLSHSPFTVARTLQASLIPTHREETEAHKVRGRAQVMQPAAELEALCSHILPSTAAISPKDRVLREALRLEALREKTSPYRNNQARGLSLHATAANPPWLSQPCPPALGPRPWLQVRSQDPVHTTVCRQCTPLLNSHTQLPGREKGTQGERQGGTEWLCKDPWPTSQVTAFCPSGPQSPEFEGLTLGTIPSTLSPGDSVTFESLPARPPTSPALPSHQKPKVAPKSIWLLAPLVGRR